MTRRGDLIVLAVVLAVGPVALSHAAGEMDRQVETQAVPWQTVAGKLIKIDGEFYVIETYEGKEFRLHVSKETKQLGGTKKVGDKIRAEITRSGHALSIQ